MRNNADRFPRPWEGRRPDKSVSQKRAASPGTGLIRGLGALPPTSNRARFMKRALLAGCSNPRFPCRFPENQRFMKLFPKDRYNPL